MRFKLHQRQLSPVRQRYSLRCFKAAEDAVYCARRPRRSSSLASGVVFWTTTMIAGGVMICFRCECDFESFPRRAYCDACVAHFREISELVNEKQRPAPGVHACGKFLREATPQSFWDDDRNRQCCGLCGSQEVEPGYGLASGRGCGSYTFCTECYAFMDFSEDVE